MMLWTAISLTLEEVEELLGGEVPAAVVGRLEGAAEGLREYARSMERQARQQWNAEMNALLGDA